MSEVIQKERLAYSLAEACKATSLSRTTLYQLSRQGKLRIRKVAGRSVIAKDDLLNLITGD